jgi:hypothetical protein
VTLANQDYDTLITELINEINAVRNKYDAFSQFTETKVADFVHTNRLLKNLLNQRTQDLAITNAQRAQLHAELVLLTTRIDRLIMQRDKARSRVKFLEASRSYRIEQKLRNIVSRLLHRK